MERGECRECHHVGMIRRVIYVCPQCGWTNAMISRRKEEPELIPEK